MMQCHEDLPPLETEEFRRSPHTILQRLNHNMILLKITGERKRKNGKIDKK